MKKTIYGINLIPPHSSVFLNTPHSRLPVVRGDTPSISCKFIYFIVFKQSQYVLLTCPPSRPHRCVFKLYALDVHLNLDPNAAKTDLEKAMEGHVIAKAQLAG